MKRTNTFQFPSSSAEIPLESTGEKKSFKVIKSEPYVSYAAQEPISKATKFQKSNLKSLKRGFNSRISIAFDLNESKVALE